MEDDTSNDVEMIESGTESEHSNITDRPLLRLIKRLINSQDNKQNTVLTNSQIVGILQTEFDIDITNLHELEVDIYLSVMKKFLKDWPKWDEFDNIISSSKSKEDYKMLDTILDQEYISLKKYLKAMIDYSMPFAKEATKKVEIAKKNAMASTEGEDNDIVLEIQCSREQLNSLIFSQPNKLYVNSIFNVVDQAPSKITLTTYFTLDTILNWWFVRLHINLPPFLYKREMKADFKHVLVNKKLPSYKVTPVPLDTNVESRNIVRKTRRVERRAYLKLLQILLYPLISKYKSHEQLIRIIIHTVENDIADLPDPAEVLRPYRKYSSKYAYVRRLFSQVNDISTDYDLLIEETISPRFEYYIGRYISNIKNLKIQDDWLIIECGFCSKKFTGVGEIVFLKAHFNENHLQEMDLECTNCHKTFSAANLSANRWYHSCT